ncbi:MAG: type II secretion system F family protein [Gammaproteobacteria bacterium]|nr:type II secretion system F family protein [Gammaproteobacteria bacterium]MBQ0838774.1 type II secretion system F family protein [Gammaproteobacteria bacterium]
MPEYTYRAIDDSGKKTRGYQQASGLEELASQLDRQGLHLVDGKLNKQAFTLLPQAKVERRNLIVLFMYLEQMAAAGISILDSLSEMRDSETSPVMRKILTALADDISSGKTLSGAMQEHAEIFTELMINLVLAGEKTGNMAQVFAELRDILTWQDDIVRKTRKLISYPLFVGTIILAVVFFLMIYLVPQLVNFIMSMNQEVPLMTRALVGLSNFFVNYWWLIISAPVFIFIVASQTLKRSQKAKYWFDRNKLEIPLFGEAISKLELARFSKNFALLYDAGISVLECLKISANISSNIYIKQELAVIREKISSGDSIYQAFSSAKLFPPLVLRMLHVGEQTGALAASLGRISEFYHRDVSELIEKIQAMIEPVMTVIMGVLLGWIMLSVLGPIYDIISTIQL